ncbi:hypothetical protein [Flavobacterium granuli]|uniref:Uncharacterized protein n=1 Tax=Flavobacterium granuli TaxID=280093 RepID=A0ABU1S2X1_9FLAO|nr:hypothetical protein [Flavobacterium granuli]MDR6844535.1 hypothetical protein [Flavobacterium granuli]
MPSQVNIKVFYGKGIRVHIKNKSFEDAMNLIWISPAFSDYEPLKIQFDSTGKTLYADRQAFVHFLKGNTDLETLIEHTQCEELYRNTKDFKAENNLIIDAGSLWKLENKTLILIDDDHVITAKPSEISIFEKIE